MGIGNLICFDGIHHVLHFWHRVAVDLIGLSSDIEFRRFVNLKWEKIGEERDVSDG